MQKPRDLMATTRNIIYNNSNSMNKGDLKNLTKSQLMKILLKQSIEMEKLSRKIEKLSQQQNDKPIPKPRKTKPTPAPRKSVKQMVQDYEENIILPPLEFRDDYKPVPKPRKTKPVPLPRTKIEEVANALKGYTKSFEISIKNNKDPLIQLQNTRKAINNKIIKILASMKGLKFVETLKIRLKKVSNDGILEQTNYFNNKPQTIINNTEIPESLQLSKQQILNLIAKWISEGPGWTIQSVDNHYLNIVQYQPMKGSSYIELPQELRHHRKGLINIKNEDNECFRWCHIRYLNPQDVHPERIKKIDKEYINQLDYSGIEFPVTTKQYNEIEKQNEININVFGYENKQPYPIFVSKEKYEKHIELLLITENENKHYVLIKDFNRFMCNQTKHEHKKHFCMHCLQCFSSEIILNNHKNNCIQVKTVTHELETVKKCKMIAKHESHILFHIIWNCIYIHLTFFTFFVFIFIIFNNGSNLLHYKMTVITSQIMEYNWYLQFFWVYSKF